MKTLMTVTPLLAGTLQDRVVEVRAMGEDELVRVVVLPLLRALLHLYTYHITHRCVWCVCCLLYIQFGIVFE